MTITHEYIFLLIRAAVQRSRITPKRRCKSLGENAVFCCSVQGEVILYWCTTGAAAECNVVTDFVNTTYSYSYEIASNVTRSRLCVPASTRYNGTRFECCYSMNGRICSEPAKLRSGKYMPVYIAMVQAHTLAGIYCRMIPLRPQQGFSLTARNKLPDISAFENYKVAAGIMSQRVLWVHIQL